MEKKKRNRIITWVIVVCVLLAILLPLCFRFIYIDQAVGDFWVRLYFNKCYIIGTTTQGNNQRYLVIPDSIKGRKVEMIGTPRSHLAVVGTIERANIGSTVIEKVYFESSDVVCHANTFDYCSNLKKIFAVCGDISYISGGVTRELYYPYQYYKSHIKTDDFTETYNSFHTKPANVSYNFNFQGAENDGYYWIDDCDYGSRIEFIPPEPERGGYTFGGWYKEPECINEWDFATDVLPEKRTEINEEGEEEVVYQETKLYAKWV